MKKILMVFIVLLSIIIPNINVYALEDSFYEGEYIPGEYIIKIRNGSGKYEQLRFFRRRSDNQAVYCIQLWEALSSNKIISGYNYEQYNYANIDYSVWERIMLIAYYGYGYQNHTDSKWYAITQFMIWKETSPDTNIYFTDTLNGNRVEKYQNEMNEINSLIQNHANVPSFYNQTYQIKYDEPMTIQDSNQVLERFDIIGDGGLLIAKDGNNLTFTKNKIGESQVLFANVGKEYSTSPIVYIDNNGQNMLAPGNYYPIYMVLNVNLPSANIIVNKLDQDNQDSLAQGDAKLIGAKIQLLDKNYSLVSESVVLENGVATFENIGYGTYYIREVSAGEGYLLNQEIITLQVDSSTEIVNLYNQVIKNKIVLNKYLKNPITGEIQFEPNALFSIYNSQNEFVHSINTDEHGQAQIVLPYGRYIVKQEYGAKNHSYVGDIVIDVTEHDIIQTFELYNEELTANIRSINVDYDSNLPILEGGAMFKIKNSDTNEYLEDTESNILILTTDDLGNTKFLTLSSGKYELEQITSIDGYEVNQNIFTFEISDDVEFKLDSNQNKYLEIIISNKKQKSTIEVEKYIRYYLNDELVKIEQDNSIMIPIYAKENIYSKDGIKIYGKDELVDIAVLNDGKVTTAALVFGNYYLKNDYDDRVIEIILNQIEPQKIKLVDEVYEYQENSSDEYIDKSITNEIEEDIEQGVIEEIEEDIEQGVIKEIEEDIEQGVIKEIEEDIEQGVIKEIEKNIDIEVNKGIKKEDSLDSEENIIIVPNTLLKESFNFNINILFIILGMFFVKKGIRYEEF